jgi:putative spermidine/putrescine transport system substrate-binding protein
MTMIRRRRVTQGIGAAGLATLLPGRHAAAQAKPERITVTSYAGIWEAAVREVFVADFTARTGVAADVLLGNPNQWISQVDANQAHPPIDVIVSTPDLVSEAGRKGLLEAISPEKVSNLKDVPEQFTKMCGGWGTCFDYGTWGIAYHKGRVKQPPKSLQEMVDRTARGDWMLSLMSPAYQPASQAMLWSLNDIYGGTLEDIGPCLNAVKRMKKNTIFWGGVTDFLNHLASNQADIGIYVDGRTWAAYDSGMDYLAFVNPTEKGVISPVAAVKPKNAAPIAWEYINTTLSPGPQARFSDRLQFGMTNTKTVYAPKIAPRITPWDQARFPPMETMGQYIPQWVERWNKEIGV